MNVGLRRRTYAGMCWKGPRAGPPFAALDRELYVAGYDGIDIAGVAAWFPPGTNFMHR